MVLGRVARRGLRASPREADWKAATEALEAVGMAGFEERGIQELSGGERQLVLIARALCQGGRLLVLDEPTSALDRSVQIKVVELLRGLQTKYGLTYIFISHDLSVVRAVSDNVAVMQHGELVEYGSADQIFHHPQKDYTKRLINAAFDL